MESICSDIVKCLSGGSSDPRSITRKKLAKKVRKRMRKRGITDSDAAVDRDVSEALDALLENDTIEEQIPVGETAVRFSLPSSRTRGVCGRNGRSERSSEGGRKSAEPVVHEEPIVVPIAELMRRRTTLSSKHGPSVKGVARHGDGMQEMQAVDLDDEIKRLENDLAEDASDDDSDSGHSTVEDMSVGRKVSFGAKQIHKEQDMSDRGVICISEVANERIAPLSSNALPQNKKRRLKGVDEEELNLRQKKKKAKKRSSDAADNHVISEGLQDTVKELLNGYVARSKERLPFYCRVCSAQSEGTDEFRAHKQTELHKAAVRAEQKATYCHACRKQLTSPVQMKEHLTSKPHREKMKHLKAKQGGREGRGKLTGGREGANRR